jgi:hypothetical protein
MAAQFCPNCYAKNKKTQVPLLLASGTDLVQGSKHSRHSVGTVAGSGTNWPVGQVREELRLARLLPGESL